jgi:hypothetical protein
MPVSLEDYMNLAHAKRIAALVRAKDTLEEWLDTLYQSQIDNKAARWTSFDITAVESENGDGDQHGWDGHMILPMDIAIRMLAHEIERCVAELTELGVDTTEPEMPEAAPQEEPDNAPAAAT